MVKRNRRNTRHRRCRSKTRATTRRVRSTRKSKSQTGGGPFSYRIPDSAVGDYHWIDDDSDAPRLMSLGDLRKIKEIADSA
jgi:hypothetical protein